MMCAAEAGDVRIGRLLLEYKADLFGVGGTQNWTAMDVARARGKDLFAKWLTEEGNRAGHTW